MGGGGVFKHKQLVYLHNSYISANYNWWYILCYPSEMSAAFTMFPLKLIFGYLNDHNYFPNIGFSANFQVI